MKSGKYWQSRFNQIEQASHDDAAACLQNIEKKYRRAQLQIETQILSWYQRFADNNEINLVDARKLLNAGELEEFRWTVQEYIRYGEENAVDGQWTKQLENASSRHHISRLEALKTQLQQQIETLHGGTLKGLTDTVTDIYKNGFYKTAFEIQKGAGVGWSLDKLDQRLIDKVINNPWSKSGDSFSSTLWKNKQKLLSEMDTELTQGIILGKDPQKIIDAMSKKLNTSKSVTGRLVMTESAFFSQQAQHDCFKDLDVEKYEIVATLDSRTSEICRGMDGKVFKMSEWEVGVTAPPFHPWCRTTTVPHFDDEFDLGERAARNEDGEVYYVPADMTYKEWQKSFVDGGLDIKFKTKPESHISSGQRLKDMKTVSAAFDELPDKVKKAFADCTFEFGYDGSACDILHRVIRVGVGAEREEIFHEVGHLIEHYILKPSDVEEYKKYLVAGLKADDIITKTYYNSVGHGMTVMLLNGDCFESEYQSRLYVSDPVKALNSDGTINIDVLRETISEAFRKYMNGEGVSDRVKQLIEGVIL